MAQLTLYVNELTLKRIEAAAKRERKSISKWAQQKLEKAWQATWPGHYFEIFGSLAGDKFSRPDQGRFAHDKPRQKL